MSDLGLLKQKANNLVEELIGKNIFKKEWDVKIISIQKQEFLYVDCDTSKVSIKLVLALCRQHFSNDLIYKLTY